MGKKKKLKKMIKDRVVQERRIGVNKAEVGLNIKGSTSTDTKVYRPDCIRMVYQLSLLGLTNAQMAPIFGIKEITFYKWIERYPEFREAMQKGKVQADSMVAEATFKNAIGYEHESVKVLSNRVKEFDKDGKIIKEYTEPVLVPITKRYPPNFNAQKYWLGIRQKGIWKDDDHTNLNINLNMDMSDFTDEELNALEKMSQKSIGTSNQRVIDTEFEEIGD